MDERKWWRVPDAATYTGVCDDTIYSACERGELRHVRIGGRRVIRLRREWVDEWLERFSRDQTLPGQRG